MYYEEYGKENEKIIVMLHGAFFTYSFGRQYKLSDKYRIILPHIMGFGNHTEKVFDTEKVVEELRELISGLGKRVVLVGFSLGAQLAYELLCNNQELFEKAILVSPWLIKSRKEMPEIIRINERQLEDLKNKTKCRLISLMNGLPKAQRDEFIEQMQHVDIETVRNAVDNGIILTDSFRNVRVPVQVLAGGKEQASIIETAKRMSEMNPNCKYEIWQKAAHNIPPVFAKRFNDFIVKTMES